MDNLHAKMPWAVSSEVYGIAGLSAIGTGRDSEKEGLDKRVVKIDGKVARAQTDLAKLFAVLWLTPQMDTLFIEGNSARRKFIDRLVFSFDGEHAARVNAYDYAMRERNRLLQERRADPHWLSALEQKMAEYGIAIAVARAHAVEHLNNAMALFKKSFPKVHIDLSGVVEEKVRQGSAVAAEQEFMRALQENRVQDGASGRALIGVHRTEVIVTHMEKNMPAELCSAGEQKAVLISIILAQARAGALWHGSIPAMLLDEVATHLDVTHRRELFEELQDIGAQAWLTGTDREVFDGMQGQFLQVEEGKISF
jgi:DNA replication and repair protein RecF